ncbi:MAG: transcription antitermination factor NusB [Candidatus Levybacteria bacterium]|nr:transcription antitermination factor NusB [Candidatus Levybacteria bacterium]
MKTPNDPRHKRRQDLVQELFSMDFHTQKVSPRAKEIFQNKNAVDQTIEKIAPDFPVEKINKVDLAILRLAIYELTVEKKTPPNVIIDEAVELAKEFGGDKSPAFINGALGKVTQHG